MNKLESKFGDFGGMYVPELLIPALDQLEQAFLDAKDDPSVHKEFMG
jgi:tryptophan synthase beta chain